MSTMQSGAATRRRVLKFASGAGLVAAVSTLPKPSAAATTGSEISVRDYATPQAAFDAAAARYPNGVRIVFPDGNYRLTDSYVVKSKNLEVAARGARFEMGVPGSTASWGKPVFLDLQQNGAGDQNRYYIGEAEYVGARGTHTMACVRGSALYCWGAVVGLNGDNTYVEVGRVIGFPTGGAFFSSWSGVSTYDRKGENNEIVIGEVAGYDFGFLWTAQKNLRITIDDAHDDIDDSGGVNQTHAYYGSGEPTFRSEGVQIVRAQARNHRHGRPWCIKHADDVRRGPHVSDSTTGVEDLISCHRFVQEVPLYATNVGSFGVGTYAVNWQVQDGIVSEGVTLASYFVHLGDDVDGGVMSVIAHDQQVERCRLWVAHSEMELDGAADIRIAGRNARWKGPAVVSTGEVHRYPMFVGYSGNTSIGAPGARVANPKFTGHDKGIRVMTADSTGLVVDYWPPAQRLAGDPSFVTSATGAARDWTVNRRRVQRHRGNANRLVGESDPISA